MINLPKKTKIAQMRAEQRKRQRKISLLSQARYACFVLAFCAQMPARSYPDNPWIFYNIALGILVLAFIFWGWLKVVQKTGLPFELGEPFTGEGVCPDCGAKGEIKFFEDKTRIQRKNVIAYLFALIIPVLPFIAFGGADFLHIQQSLAADVVVFSTPLLVLFLPFFVALDRSFKTRLEVCYECGRAEYIGSNRTDVSPNLAIKAIEHFWLKVVRYRWWLAVVGLILSFVIPFGGATLFPEHATYLGGFLFLPLFMVGVLIFIGMCNQKFYEGYFEIEPPKPKGADEINSETAAQH
jgi:hypothetical protein